MLGAVVREPWGGDMFFGGLCTGMFIIGMIWVIVAAHRMTRDNEHKHLQYGVWYNTSKSHRLLGHDGERITKNGQWIYQMISLWRTYKDDLTKKHHFYLLEIDELNPAKITPIKDKDAENWILRHADTDHANKLLLEWFKNKEG